jgi:hypothetical protein
LQFEHDQVFHDIEMPSSSFIPVFSCAIISNVMFKRSQKQAAGQLEIKIR